MNFFNCKNFSRDLLKNEHFHNWDGVRAFIFEDGLLHINQQMVDIDILVGIVYNPEIDLKVPLKFCVYGKPNGYYKKKFEGSPACKKVIPVFKSLGENEVEFIGCFEVVYIGVPRPICTCELNNKLGVLVGEIELIAPNKKC